ncbi:MAG: patatin-like phospholipase family protein [Eubacteriaceae bacterium]|nr:patatin-like phospholipase family protein [Eubacteriaceae bacterium]
MEYGLVLSSDGSKSSFEIGAWKALRELNIHIPSVSGSFVGAINAALIAQGDFEKAVRFWRNASAQNLFYVNKTIAQKYTEEWSKAETRQFRRQFINFIQGRTEELTPLRSLVESYIDERLIRQSKTSLGFVSISVMTLEAEMLTLNKIPRGRLPSYLLAAACFPQIAQVNRAQDPSFSLEYSPYWIIQNTGTEKILSTDDVLVIPPTLASEVDIIAASEAMELTLNESVEKMRANIKLGYMDTMRKFEESLGAYYLIKRGASIEFERFKQKLGSELPAHLNGLLALLLGLSEFDSNAVRSSMFGLLSPGAASDRSLMLLENAARFIGVKNDERFVPDLLLSTAISESRKSLEHAKNQLMASSDLRQALLSASEPARSVPEPALFMKYFVVLISAKPDKYDRFLPFLEQLSPKATAALATLLYLTYT